MKCSMCGKELTQEEMNSNFCSCGEPIHAQPEVEPVEKQVEEPAVASDDKIRCHKCKFPNPSGTKKCKKCGVDLLEEEGPPKKDENLVICLGCGKTVDSKCSFCPYCSKQLHAGKVVCKKCGRERLDPTYNFCPFCGSSFEVECEQPSNSAVLVFPDGKEMQIDRETIIGRKDFENCMRENIISRNQFGWVSRRHAKITCEGGIFFVEDMGSLNGTLLNGEEIKGKGKMRLNDGDVLMLAGDEKMKLIFKRNGVEVG